MKIKVLAGLVLPGSSRGESIFLAFQLLEAAFRGSWLLPLPSKPAPQLTSLISASTLTSSLSNSDIPASL